MSYVDTLRDKSEDVLDTAFEVVDEAAVAVPGLARKALQEYVDRQAFGAGRLIPNGWVDEAADALIWAADGVLDGCREVLEELREANGMLGSPDTLRKVAEDLGRVAEKAESIQITKSLMPGLISWDDPPASRVYDLATDDQTDPLSRVASTANDIASAIKQHANDIESYYLELSVVILSAVGTIAGVATALIGALTAAGTGPAGAAVAILGLVTAATSGLVLIVSLLQLTLSRMQGTQSTLDSLPDEITEWKKPGFVQIQ